MCDFTKVLAIMDDSFNGTSKQKAIDLPEIIIQCSIDVNTCPCIVLPLETFQLISRRF